MLFGAGCNKKGELGIGTHKSSPFLQPIFVYVYDAIYETEDVDEKCESNGFAISTMPYSIPPALQQVVSKIPGDITVHAMNGIHAGSCGASFSMLCTENGNCLFAGLNDSCQLGVDSLVGNLPMPLFFNVMGRNCNNMKTISCGFDHTVRARSFEWIQFNACAEREYRQVCLAQNGSVWTWGEKSSGQLGVREGSDTGAMQEVTSLREDALGGDRVVQAVAGGSHTLVVTASGGVISFGSNIKVAHEGSPSRQLHRPPLTRQLGAGAARRRREERHRRRRAARAAAARPAAGGRARSRVRGRRHPQPGRDEGRGGAGVGAQRAGPAGPRAKRGGGGAGAVPRDAAGGGGGGGHGCGGLRALGGGDGGRRALLLRTRRHGAAGRRGP